jgi:hypothetical protein
VLNLKQWFVELKREEIAAMVQSAQLTVRDRRIREEMITAIVDAFPTSGEKLLSALRLATLRMLGQLIDIDIKNKKKGDLVSLLYQYGKQSLAPKKAKKIASKSTVSSKKTGASKKKQPAVDSAAEPINPRASSEEPNSETQHTSEVTASEPDQRIVEISHKAKTVSPSYFTHVPTEHYTEVWVCTGCQKKYPMQKCGSKSCDNFIIKDPARRLCAECLFARNALSIHEFNAMGSREHECPECGKHIKKSKSAALG